MNIGEYCPSQYKIFNKVLNMNWDYVRVKKKQKENKNKQTERKQTKKTK
jgi:hypothetical protein